MDREKGIAFCGLACCLCEEQPGCPGCRGGGCPGAEDCRNFRCCREKNLEGCWQCPEFPCESRMFDSLRTRAFVRYVKEHGTAALMERLDEGEKAGIRYHDPGRLTGDYDRCQSEEEVLKLLEGSCQKGKSKL